MLEGLVATVLNRFLGMYVRNFDAKQLQVGIWSGQIKLSNLDLRREALDQLHLPINVVEGHVGNLVLEIPFSNLKGKPVKVSIENVFLLASPKVDAEYNEEEEKQRANATKLSKLESAELLKERNTEGLSQEEQQKNQSFVNSLTTAIVDNLQVTVKNIHIRYEDTLSNPGHSFALGITLQQFSAVSTNGEWKPALVQATETSYKLATLESLAVYWDTDCQLFDSGSSEHKDHDDLLQKFTTGIDEDANHQFILKPVHGKATIELDKTGKASVPKTKARLLFDEFGFILDDSQYQNALMLVDLFHQFMRHQEFKKYRPKTTLKEDPKAWFRYGGDAILNQIHERNRRWSWDYFRERRDDRKRYITLFKLKRKGETMSTPDQDELRLLEEKLSYEDLRFWRSLARNQLRKENVGAKKPPPKQTWGQWAWNLGKAPESDTTEQTELTEEQREELYKAIDWDEKNAASEAIDLPKDTVKIQLEAMLGQGSFTLLRNPHGSASEVLKILFDHLTTRTLVRPTSMLAKVSLGGFRVFDGTTKDTLYPQIVRVKDEESRIEDTENTERKSLDLLAPSEQEDPLFDLEFEQNPLDNSADNALTLKLKGIEVIYNARCITEVAKFFRPPQKHLESVTALLDSASATVEGFRQQTRAGLEFALQEHKTINAKLDVQAPLIIVPESILQRDSMCLILDAGHAELRSELVDKATLDELRAEHNSKPSEMDVQRLEELMYDKFHLSLKSTQILIGRGVEDAKQRLKDNAANSSWHILKDINMGFLVELSILPQDVNLTKTRISGQLPLLHASISDMKYKTLMRLIDVAIPKFSESDDEHSKTDQLRLTDQKQTSAEQEPPESLPTRPRSASTAADFHDMVADEDESDSETLVNSVSQSGSKKNQPINFEQRLFEFRFQVGELRGSLFRSSSSETAEDNLLVELIAHQFELDFYTRPYDMIASVSLESLQVDDHVEENPSPDFKNIVSSQTDIDGPKSRLLNVHFARVQQSSPEFIEVYNGISTNLDVDVSTINVVVTRKTLLTLLDFILVTFTNSSDQVPSATAPQSIEGPPNEQQDTSSNNKEGSDADNENRISVKANLRSIALILNDDGIRLATLKLDTATAEVFLSGPTMRINSRLESLSLFDDINQGAERGSPFRSLVSIEGDNLADFHYQTFSAQDEEYPGYDSEVYLRSGSIKVNFLEEPFRKIVTFLVRFGRMQALFDAARRAAANQAEQLQKRTSRMHLDVLIRTPIVVFPRINAAADGYDSVTAFLGEIYCNNQFVETTEKDNHSTPSINLIKTGIRNIRLVSEFNDEDGGTHKLRILRDLDLDLTVKQLESESESNLPDIDVDCTLSPVDIQISPAQTQFLLALSREIPGAFDTSSAAETPDTLPTTESVSTTTKDMANLQTAEESTNNIDPTGVRVNLVFNAPRVGLKLILAPSDQTAKDLEACALSTFSINETNMKLQMMKNGALELELLVHSFSIRDDRPRDSDKFRTVMTLLNEDVKQQFMTNVSISAGEERHLLAMVTIDSPKIHFALDYLMSLVAFSSQAFATPESAQTSLPLLEDESSDVEMEDQAHDPQSTEKADDSQDAKPMSISVRVNIEDAQVVLIANPSISNSEAIVLGTRQLLFSKQNASTLQITEIGMFLCRMDKFDTSRLRILDDFSLLLSMDNKSDGPSQILTTIHVEIDPLVLRLSLRDILLALQIATKASAINSQNSETLNGGHKASNERRPSNESQESLKGKPEAHEVKSNKRPGTLVTSSVGRRRSSAPAPSEAVIRKEELSVDIQGLRVVLIGDLHELPLLDWSVKKFSVGIRDWSATLVGDTTLDMFLNVYNFSKSAWEPLIEPWTLGVHMSREQDPEHFSIDLYSHKTMELTITSATIALASKTAQFLSIDQDVLSKPRGAEAPYRIRNYTGFDVQVWSSSESDSSQTGLKLSDGAEEPWQFVDIVTMRENLASEGTTGTLGIKLEGSGFDAIDRISVTREGEKIYSLRPRKNQVQHRLLVEVSLGDNVKYITLRSPLLVENNSQIPIELGIYSPEDGHLLKVEKILPGEGRPAPVGAAYDRSLVVRPDQGFGYAWSKERYFWKNLAKRPIRTVACEGENADMPPFFFQMNTVFSTENPTTSVYPYLRIKLSAPIEIENLLPFDFKYRIYDKNTKKDWTNFLRRGGVSPVHVVELSHLLLLSIDLQNETFKQSDYAVINSTSPDYQREMKLVLKDQSGLALNLKLHYFSTPESGGSFKVSIYSPYVVLNRTGFPLDIQSKTMFSSARSSAGKVQSGSIESGHSKAAPYMFSFPNDEGKNRVLLKLGDSTWSKPQSFDAIGSSYEVVVPHSNSRSELHIGVTVNDGEGKYNLVKVVNVSPRFIVNNKLSEAIQVREPGSSDFMTIGPTDLMSLSFLKKGFEKQLCVSFPGADNTWSAAFGISDIGTIHVKMAKAGEGQRLLKIESILEGATIFIHISMETKHWPFSMRNESDTEFVFYQTNPNVNEDDEEEEDIKVSSWRPVRYRLPARSIMPYAWDFPSARTKALVVVANRKERRIKLAEIGSLIPMRLSSNKIIDLAIVAEGPTQTLIFSNYQPGESLYKTKTGMSSPTESTMDFEAKEIQSDVTFSAVLRFAGIGLSLVNSQPRELLYLTLREIELKYTDSPLYQSIKATIKWIQVDNQLYGGLFPILIYPSVVPKSGKEMDAHPIFHAAVTRVKDDSYGVLYIKYATLLLQQLTIELDEDFIFTMLEFAKVPGASWTEIPEGKLADEDLGIPEPKLLEQGQDVYFELLHLQPMQLDLSFVRTERINAEDTEQTSNPLMFFVNVLTMSLGNVNDAPLRLNALMLENARVSTQLLITNIRSHYTQEVLRQIHVVLGSADFLGNPVGLFNNLSSGVADIFYEPYQGLVMNDRPQDLGFSIAKGASSFVKKSVFGFSDSMAKFTGSLSKGLAAATLDKDYQDQRRSSRARNRPKHALYGLTSGGNAFASSLASGIGGLARHPLEGAEKEGFQGFMKGVGKGFLGLATKPAIGAFDLASTVAEGVRNTTTVFDQEGLDRVRLSRFIGMDGIVRPYAQREALGQFWLKTLDSGKYFGEDYIAHLELQNKEIFVMLTYNRIMLVKSRNLKSEWDIKLTDITTISKERTGMGITLKGGTNGPFIPVTDESSRNWLYKQIAVAVEAFNDRYSVSSM